ncbi:MAG: hypothetical protein AB7I27_12660 [Bacteriovoracaceae bacterium]
MKVFLLTSLLFLSFEGMAQDFLKKIKEIKVEDLKKKGCPLVNGKEDCSADEIKNKALELKKKFDKK